MTATIDSRRVKIYPRSTELESLTTESPDALTSLTTITERLRSDLENVQRELDQALGVWRQTLINEKREFQSKIQGHQRAWEDDENRWQDQRKAYEDRVIQLETAFQAQLTTSEQNALQSLNALDQAWQREKLNWHQAAQQKVTDLEKREAEWKLEQERLTVQVRDLEAQLDQARTLTPPVTLVEAGSTPEDVHMAWDRDRLVWQESLRQTSEVLQEREAAWKAERERHREFVESVQFQLSVLQTRLSELGPVADSTPLVFETAVSALENQVSAIEIIFRVLIGDGNARR